MPASALWWSCKDSVTYYTHPVLLLFLCLKDAMLCDGIIARTACVRSEAQTYMHDCWHSAVSVGGVTQWTCHTLLPVWCFPTRHPKKYEWSFFPVVCCMWWRCGCDCGSSVDLWNVSPEVVMLLKAMTFFWSSSYLTTACMSRCYAKPQTMMLLLSDWSCDQGFKLLLPLPNTGPGSRRGVLVAQWNLCTHHRSFGPFPSDVLMAFFKTASIHSWWCYSFCSFDLAAKV